MKSKKTIILLSALAALCLASCDKNEEVSVNDGAVRFTASIGREAVAKPQSRAAGTAWAAGDEIGIFMVKHGTLNIAEMVENKKYTTATSNGIFTPVTGNEIYYPMDNSGVDFIAYYPHEAGAQLATDLPVEIATTQDDATQAATDLMWAKADNSGKGYEKDENAIVALAFGHCLSKLTMNCKVDPSVGQPAVLNNATVSIHGMNTRSTFDLATGTLGTTPDRPEDIAPRKLSAAPAGSHGAYDAIILPETYAGGVLTVKFTINGEPFVWYVDAIEFKPGHEYIYAVTITRTGVTATGTIVKWNPVEMGGVTAE